MDRHQSAPQRPFPAADAVGGSGLNGGHDPDWLAFPPPEGWVLVDDDGEDYAPFWRAEVDEATEVEGRINTEAAAALATDAIIPVLAITRV